MNAVCVGGRNSYLQLGSVSLREAYVTLQSIGLQLNKEDLHMLVHFGANETGLTVLMRVKRWIGRQLISSPHIMGSNSLILTFNFSTTTLFGLLRLRIRNHAKIYLIQ